MTSETFSINELKAFFSLKMNKSRDHDGINFNIARRYFSGICGILKYIFNLSDNFKISKATFLFKADDTADLSNYRPISLLLCLLKNLKRVMYNCLYQYLLNQETFHPKQFGFHRDHSTDYALIQLVDHIHNTFVKNKYTLVVFVALSKTLDSVGYITFLMKLKCYGKREIT